MWHGQLINCVDLMCLWYSSTLTVKALLIILPELSVIESRQCRESDLLSHSSFPPLTCTSTLLLLSLPLSFSPSLALSHLHSSSSFSHPHLHSSLSLPPKHLHQQLVSQSSATQSTRSDVVNLFLVQPHNWLPQPQC